MVNRSDNKINIDALRMIPYATLVRALVGCFMLISIGTAFFGRGMNVKQGNDIFISSFLLGILLVLGDTLAIYCLCGLLDMSERFKTTLILLIAAVILYCIGILMRSGEIYMNTLNYLQSEMVINLANNVIYIVEKIVHAVAMCIFMKALGEVLARFGSNRTLSKSLSVLGTSYLAFVVIINAAIAIEYTKGKNIGPLFFLISLLIGTLLELVFFFIQRKATMQKWKDLYGRNRF